jgi:uncharacterized membrane protein
MQETLRAFFEPLINLNPIIYVIIIAFVPLIELRGSILAAIWCLKMSAGQALGWSLLGSILPAFVVIPFFAWSLSFLEQRHWLPWLTRFLNKKFVTKAQKVAAQNEAIALSDRSTFKKELLKFWAIVIFVGIPLPGTGVWTGSAVASLIKMPFPQAFAAVLLGDIIAGVIMTAVALLTNSAITFC